MGISFELSVPIIPCLSPQGTELLLVRSAVRHSEVQRSHIAERLSQLAEAIIYPFACSVSQLAICWHVLFSGMALSLDRATETGRASSGLDHLEDLRWTTPCGGVELVLLLGADAITLCSHVHTGIKQPALMRRSEHVSPCKSEAGGGFKASFICKMGGLATLICIQMISCHQHLQQPALLVHLSPYLSIHLSTHSLVHLSTHLLASSSTASTHLHIIDFFLPFIQPLTHPTIHPNHPSPINPPIYLPIHPSFSLLSIIHCSPIYLIIHIESTYQPIQYPSSTCPSNIYSAIHPLLHPTHIHLLAQLFFPTSTHSPSTHPPTYLLLTHLLYTPSSLSPLTHHLDCSYF